MTVTTRRAAGPPPAASAPAPARTMGLLAATLASSALALSACAPPEAQRARGGGPGADIGNRSRVIEMHAGSVIYPDERCFVQGAACTGPMPLAVIPPRATAPLGHDAFVLEEMGRGGALRRVIYTAPPELAVPTDPELEPAQPGPETGRGDVDEGGDPVDPADQARSRGGAPGGGGSQGLSTTFRQPSSLRANIR
jgi:hypothetical protein